MNFEDDLKRALEREQPPEGFSRRVLERVAQRRRAHVSRNWMAVAAMFVLCAFLAAGYREYQQGREAAARQAGRELLVALKITGSKLQADGK